MTVHGRGSAAGISRWALRLRRFGCFAAKGLGHDLRVALRSAARFSFVRHLLRNVRSAWIRSDPDWVRRLQESFTPTAEQRDAAERARREREQSRAQRAAQGPAVYHGEVVARVAGRGIVLSEHPQRAHLDDWVAETLALDTYVGDHVRARISVELLCDDLST